MSKSERAQAIRAADALYRAAEASGREFDYWEARAAMAAALRPDARPAAAQPSGNSG